MRLYGTDAIEAKKSNNEIELNKSTDPIEEERFDISIEDAEEIATEDPSLIWTEIED